MKSLNKIVLAAVGVALSIASVGVSAGGSALGTAISPTVTLTSACSVNTTGMSVSFGTFAVGSADQTAVAAGTVATTCTTGVSYRVGFAAGLNSTAAGRRLANGTNYISYNLKNGAASVGDVGLNALDNAYTETTGGWTAQALPAVAGNGAAQTSPAITADVLINAQLTAGTYNDTVAVVVAW